MEEHMSLEAPTARPLFVNEHAGRAVAGMVALLAGSILAFDLPWLLALLAYEFGARVLAGHRFSAMALLATRVIVPALGLAPRWTPAPPKRFAQAIGLLVSSAALVTWPLLGLDGVGRVLLALLLVFAFLEAALGFCAGCYLFGRLMALGLIPARVCEVCRADGVRS